MLRVLFIEKCSDPVIDTHANITEPPTPVPGSGPFYTNGSSAKYKCDDGYRFVDKTKVKSIVCQGGQWTGLEVCKGDLYLRIIKFIVQKVYNYFSEVQSEVLQRNRI